MRKSKRIYYTLLKCFLLSLISGPAFSQGPIPVYGNPELQPLHFADAEGQPKGYWVDIVNQMNAHLGTEFIVQLRDVRLAADDLMENPAPGLLGVVIEAFQSLPGYEYFTFSKPFGTFNLRFYTIGNEALLLEGFAEIPETVAVVGPPGAFARKWLEASYPQVEIHPVDTFFEGIERIQRGESDAFLGSEWAIRYAFNTKTDLLNGLIEGPIVFTSNMTFAAHNDYAYLIDQVNTFQEYATSNDIISNTYLQWVPEPPLTPLQFSRLEYLRLKDKVIVLSVSIVLILIVFFGYIMIRKLLAEQSIKNLQRISLLKINHDIRSHLDRLKKGLSPDLFSTKTLNYEGALNEIDFISELLIPQHTDELKYTKISTENIIKYFEKISHTYNVLAKIEVGTNETHFLIHMPNLKYATHNILRNIKQHTSADAIEISIQKVYKPDRLKIIISHLGNPFPNDVVAYINSKKISSIPPYKSNNSSGLGLHLIKSIYDQCHWAFEINSKSGINSFSIEIPQIPKLTNELPDAPTTSIEISRGDVAVIIDDDIISRELSSLQFKHHGIIAYCASIPDEAIELIRGLKVVNLVILDVNLGRFSGIDVAEVLINKLRFSASKIIIVSGEILSENERERLHKLGIQKLILKPDSVFDHLSIRA